MEWKPNRWVAVVLGFFLPSLGLLYVQRPWWAFFYMLAGLALSGALVVGLFNGVDVQFVARGIAAVSVACPVAAMIHSYRVAAGAAPIVERKWYSRWYGLLPLPLVLFAVVFLFRAFLYEPYRMVSDSMFPTLPEGSLLIVSKRGYGDYGTYGVRLFHSRPTVEIKRTQLIMFRRPGQPDAISLIRVIGLPGDHVVCRGAQLYINQFALPTTLERQDNQYRFMRENHDGEIIHVAHLKGIEVPGCDVVVPPDQYFVMSDNRGNTRDSRYIGTIPRESLIGGVARAFAPVKH